MLQGKKILVGLTASIAAYKTASIVRLLVREGAEVQVIMTPMAREFITPVTLSALSGKPVHIEFFSGRNGQWDSHVDLGIWADLFLIAPVTASTLGKMAHGIADNLLLTTYLSCKCPVILAPAMDMDMYQHPSTSRNIEILQSYGNRIIEPGTGELASGLYGKGRMEEPEIIVEKVKSFFVSSGDKKKSKRARLEGIRILITAGPTHEKIDPVRFIGNHSSGKMGFAIAEACAMHGASVLLVSGPVNLETAHPGITRFDVTSSEEMAERCFALFGECRVGIMTAAVADYTPSRKYSSKMKRTRKNWSIELEPTPDIAAGLGKMKREDQVLVGFALETDREELNAQNKLKEKNFDFIVLNSLNDNGAGFGVDTNKITIIDADNNIRHFELKSKGEVALDIIDKLVDYV